jgi:hypothetical protein
MNASILSPRPRPSCCRPSPGRPGERRIVRLLQPRDEKPTDPRRVVAVAALLFALVLVGPRIGFRDDSDQRSGTDLIQAATLPPSSRPGSP